MDVPAPQPVDARVFSGTGNSLRVARWFGGEDADVKTLEAPGALTLRDGAMLLLACPTHGFTAPWNVVRFAWALPRGEGRGAAVLVTRAGLVLANREPPGLAGTGPFLLALVLWLRGYRVRGAASINMPSNWISLHTGLSAPSVERILQSARREVEPFAARIRAGGRWWLTTNLLYELVGGVLLAPLSLLYVLVGGRLLGQFFFANRACTGCGQCGLACPVGAIRMEGSPARPRWTLDCTSCMRCMAYCPRRAIEASWGWGVLSTAISVAPGLAWFAAFGVPRPLGIAWLDGALLSGAYLVFSVVVMEPLTRLLQRVLRRPAINALFVALTPTRWFRRYHEPGTRLRVLAPRMSKRRGEPK